MDAVPEEALAPPGVAPADVILPLGGNPGPLGVAPQPAAVPGALGGLGGLGPSVTDPPLAGYGYGGGMPPGAAAPGAPAASAPASYGPSNLSQGVRARLDHGALQALGELETAEADSIAFRLEQAGASVRNPSAYVHRAVNNARRRGAVQPGAGGLPGLGGGGAPARLDANALTALQELAPGQAAAILDELASKGAGVRNPSAYVVKAVGNARRQEMGGGMGGPQGGYPPQGGYGGPPQGGYGGGYGGGYPPRGPPQGGYGGGYGGGPQQPYPGTNLQYPGNSYQGGYHQGGGGGGYQGGGQRGYMQPQRAPPPQGDPVFNGDAQLFAEYAQLDHKAMGALQALPTLQAAQIILELRRKRGAIRNPSAYVMRATANAQAGNPGGAPQRAPPEAAYGMAAGGGGYQGNQPGYGGGGAPYQPPQPPAAAAYDPVAAAGAAPFASPEPPAPGAGGFGL